MASISRRLLFHSRHRPSRISASCVSPKQAASWQRHISSTARLRADDEQPNAQPSANETAAAASPRPSPTTDELRKLVDDLRTLNPAATQDAPGKGAKRVPVTTAMELDRHEDFRVQPNPREKLGFWAEGEENLGADEDYYGDDLTSLGHGELEQHRELREYARLIAWELPLLSQLARPFEPPTAATPFRFRYTSYLGESHPATNKVVVEFSAADMKLTPVQRDKLVKLAGPRYNPDTDIIKMSCEDFDTQAQNKRFLGETIHRLLEEAKNGQDTFADVPFDFRHHKPKKRHVFPEEWRVTPERKKYLEEQRASAVLLDADQEGKGLLVDGKKVIDTRLFATQQPEPVMVGGPRGQTLR